MFIFHTTRNSEKQEENCWEKFHSGVYFLKKSSSKKKISVKKEKKSIQYHQIRCYQYHLRTTLILQGLDLKLAKMLKFDLNIMFSKESKKMLLFTHLKLFIGQMPSNHTFNGLVTSKSEQIVVKGGIIQKDIFNMIPTQKILYNHGKKHPITKN